MGSSRDLNELREKLAAFLPNGARITGLRPLTGGHSNETHVIEGLDLILRMAPATLSFESHGIITQARIYDEVGQLEGAPPVPKIHHIGESPDVLGGPFYIMQRVDGVAVDDYNLPEWFTTLSEAQRGALCQSWTAAIGSIATLPPIDALGKPNSPEDELRHWRQISADGGATELVARIDRILALPAPRSGAYTLVHGDCKISNMLFDDCRISSVLDWEFAYNGEPLSDLGYMLYFFAGECHGPTRPTRLSGMWTREQVIAEWEQASGRSAVGIEWHEVAEIARVSAMIVTAARQYTTGESSDQRFGAFAAKLNENIATLDAMLEKLEA